MSLGSLKSSDGDTARVFSRRAFVIGGLQATVLAVLGGRLGYLQVAQGERYSTLAEKNRINVKLLAPERGRILDRFGVALAENTQNFKVVVIPEQTKDIKHSLKALRAVINVEETGIQRVLKEVRTRPKYAAIEVKDNLSWDEVARIEVNLPDLPGLSTEVGDLRSYPFANASAHLIGYVGAVSERDIAKAERDGGKKDTAFDIPGFKIGKTGIENRFDEQLRGRSGAAQVEVNVIGREIRELRRKDSEEGNTTVLSIDAQLQNYTQERLAEQRSASAVVMDADTGAVYALASHPAFDPNIFSRGIPHDIWNALSADITHPLTNKAIAGQYPPASTFKMITAIAALKAGKTNSKRTVYCPGHYDFGNRRFHCWKKQGHGSVDIIDAIKYSCDTYFYELASEVGIDRIAEVARMFGLGSKLDFDLPQERSGLVPDRKWKLGNRGERWHPGETIVSAIGQGYLQATPLQLAVMTARLVNGGYAVKPWVTGYLGDTMLGKTKDQWPKLDIDDWYLHLMKRAMNAVVNEERGTAFSSRIEDPDMAMGGKTGTAQVKRITKAERAAGVKNEDLEWKFRHHALFVGYAPLKNPRYVTAVVVEHGVGGSRSAAPIAKDLLLKAQARKLADTEIMKPGAV